MQNCTVYGSKEPGSFYTSIKKKGTSSYFVILYDPTLTATKTSSYFSRTHVAVDLYLSQQEADCKKMVDAAVDTFGGLNVAFNNAGIYMAASLAETSDEMATSLLDINLKSHVFCYKYQVNILL